MLIDYHIHNHFSPDSESETEKIAAKAVERGMKEICITNHGETFLKDGGRETFTVEEAVKRFSACRKEIAETQKAFPNLPIRFGAEIEYKKEWLPLLKTFVDKMDFDFIIGSHHIVDGVVISSHHFAADLFSRAGEKEAYAGYFEGLLKMVEWGHFDAVGHFDIIKKYGHQFYGPFRPKKYKPEIMAVLLMMKDKGIGIELNANCLRDKCKELFPHPDILKWCLKIGIENYTMGSDGHEWQNTGLNIKEALQIAKDVGIPAISTYIKRRPTQHFI
ncbi:histidinol-phosphatase HisJ family protein [Candidatus Peregrinibacteria bacterium]|nr:histidinol-phosphatase HisJ family protein [Candidatus Peregrinibacteria bacterium]